MTGTERLARLDLDSLDARLAALGVADDGDDDSDWDLAKVDARWLPPVPMEDRYSAVPTPLTGPVAAPQRRRVVPLHRSTSSDAALRLPEMVVPNGYRRDPRGTWRYAEGGRSVPGARDVTIDTLYIWGRQRHPLWVRVPVAEARRHVELEWVLDHWDPTGERTVVMGTPRRHVQVIEAPRREWEMYAKIPLGIDAPELLAHSMLSTLDVARMAGVSDKTITAYLARRQMPEPQLHAGRTPLWARPVIELWLARRG